MTALISLSKLSSSTNNTNTNNVNLNIGTSAETRDVKVEYSEKTAASDTIVLEKQIKSLQNECEVLKLIIEMWKNNPLLYNGYIIADDATLMKFVQLLTSADDVQIDADDVGEGCLTKKTYRKVHAIYVIKDGQTKNLKYDYPQVMKALREYSISTKLVW